MSRLSEFRGGRRRIASLFRTLTAGVGLLAGAAAMLPRAATAQTTTGSIRGYTRDPQGAPVPGVQIGARSTTMGVTRGAVSNADGFYNLAGLRPGTWELTVRRIGFAAQTRTIEVQIGQVLDANFVITANAQQLSGVTVVANAPAERKTSEVATNVTQAQIADLPSASRNILDLAALAPGVHVDADRIDATSKKFSSGAQPAENINIFIDGSSYKNDIVTGGVAGQDASRGNPFPRSAVQEYRVATSNFKAEYQKASSAVITAVTKSGTNEWQGSAFGSYINQGLVALDSFNRATKATTPGFKKPDYSRTQLGLSGGGPLVENKLFFFGSYEANLQHRQGVTRLNGAPATWPAVIAAVNGETHDAPFTSHLGFGKLTWNQSERQLFELSADARLEGDKRDFSGQSTCSCFAYSTGDNFHSNVVTERLKHSYFGARGTNEALLSYQTYRWHNQSFDFNTPARDYAGIGRIGGHDAEQDLRQKRLSLRDDYTFSTSHWAGAHVPKIGANVDFDRYDMKKALNDNPTYFYNSNNNFSTPVQAIIGFGNPTIATNNTQFGLYAQDDWSPTQQLTFNLGLRWDYESNMFDRSYVTPQAIRDSISAYSSQFFVPVDPNRYFTNGSQRKPFYGAIQPRLGASYALDKDARTTVFAGWGVFYDRLYFNATLDELYRRQHQTYTFNFGNGAGQIPWNASYDTRAGLLAAIANGKAPPQEVYLVPNDLKPPHSQQWTAGVRHDFGSWNGSIAYNDQRSFNGYSYEWANVTYSQGIDCCKVVSVPAYSNILVGNNSVHTWYHGVQVQVDRPYHLSTSRWGWGAGLAWTIAKAEQEGNDLFSFPQVAKNPRHPTPNDERHHVVANFITDVPYAWGIQFSGLLTLGTGSPINRVVSTNTQGTIIVPGFGYPKKYSFIIPHAFAYRNLDLRLRKNFVNVGGNALGVTADVFNVFNYDNFGCFNNSYGTINNGTFTGNATYGNPGCVVADARRLQIGLSYDFLPHLSGR